MVIYTAQSTFAGNAALQDATGGWDVVYAVKFSTMNEDFLHRQPWNALRYSQHPGRFFVDASSAGTDNTLEGKIAGMKIVPGGPPKHVRFEITIIHPDFKTSGLLTNTLTKIVVFINAKLQFSAGSEPGLRHLSVTQEFDVGDVDFAFTPAFSPGFSGLAKLRATDCIMALFTGSGAARSLLSGALATVYTRDYAHSVNLPWLVPETVAYAVADLSQTEGVLAVLGRVSDEPRDLTDAISVEAIPIDTDINAVAIISPRVLAEGTFYKALNNSLGQGGFADFIFDQAAQVVWNEKEVFAFYRINDATGWSEILTKDGLGNSTGRTYPLTIRKHGLKFSFTGNAIRVELSSAIVDLGHGSRMTLTMSQEIELVVQPDGNIDFVPVGAPEETSMVFNGPDAAEAETSSFGKMLLVTLVVETIVFAVDRFWAHASQVPTSQINKYTADCLAAVVQCQKEGVPVTVEIGKGRQLVITRKNLSGDPVKFDRKYHNSTQFKPSLASLESENTRTEQRPGPTNQIHSEVELTQNSFSQEPLIVEEVERVGRAGGRRDPNREPAPAATGSSPLDKRRTEVQQFLYNATQALASDGQYSRFVEAALGKKAPSGILALYGGPLEQRLIRAFDTLKNDGKTATSTVCQSRTAILDLDDLQLRQIYERTAKYIQGRRAKGMIGDVDYVRILENSPVFIDFNPRMNVANEENAPLLGPRPLVVNPGDIRIEARNKSLIGPAERAPIEGGILQNFRDQVGSEIPATALSSIRVLIAGQPAPKWVTLGTIAVYIAGLAFGMIAPNLVPSESTASKTRRAEADVLGTSDPNLTEKEKAKLAATRLFGAVSFPFMTQFQSSDLFSSPGPRPDAVLKSAAINGGLILGVSIVTNI